MPIHRPNPTSFCIARLSSGLAWDTGGACLAFPLPFQLSLTPCPHSETGGWSCTGDEEFIPLSETPIRVCPSLVLQIHPWKPSSLWQSCPFFHKESSHLTPALLESQPPFLKQWIVTSQSDQSREGSWYPLSTSGVGSGVTQQWNAGLKYQKNLFSPLPCLP